MDHNHSTENGAVGKEGTLASEKGKKKQQSRKKQENKIARSPPDTDDVVILCKTQIIWLKLNFSFSVTQPKTLRS